MLMNSVLRQKKAVNLTLVTDKDGIINLGHLKHIIFVQASISQYEVEK